MKRQPTLRVVRSDETAHQHLKENITTLEDDLANLRKAVRTLTRRLEKQKAEAKKYNLL